MAPRNSFSRSSTCGFDRDMMPGNSNQKTKNAKKQPSVGVCGHQTHRCDVRNQLHALARRRKRWDACSRVHATGRGV